MPISETEHRIIQEVTLLLKSKKFRSLRTAYKKGKQKTVIIFGRTISFDPEIPYSGMTYFEKNSFAVGAKAFKNREELIKTLLHEIYRLEKSVIRNTRQASQQEVTEETNAAHAFAERTISYFGNFL